MSLTFRGLMAPAFTAFSGDGKQVNLQIIPEYARYLEKNGIHGVLVNGTSGEGMSMTLSERKSTTETWLSAARPLGIHVQVQVGGTNLPDVLELARHAEQHGADSLLCLPELFNKPSNVSELVEYLKEVAAAAPSRPFLYYHNPGYTAVSVNVPTLMREASRDIPTFAGVKFTDTNLEMGVQCVALGRHSVFLGCDFVLAGAFALGFDSSIATCLNILPALCRRILDLIQTGNLEEARRAQRTLNAAASAITKNGKWVATMKASMKLVSGLDMGPARSPLRSLAEEHVAEMKKDLHNLKIV